MKQPGDAVVYSRRPGGTPGSSPRRRRRSAGRRARAEPRGVRHAEGRGGRARPDTAAMLAQRRILLVTDAEQVARPRGRQDKAKASVLEQHFTAVADHAGTGPPGHGVRTLRRPGTSVTPCPAAPGPRWLCCGDAGARAPVTLLPAPRPRAPSGDAARAAHPAARRGRARPPARPPASPARARTRGPGQRGRAAAARPRGSPARPPRPSCRCCVRCRPPVLPVPRRRRLPVLAVPRPAPAARPGGCGQPARTAPAGAPGRGARFRGAS